jgi:hypothetical protein
MSIQFGFKIIYDSNHQPNTPNERQESYREVFKRD